jgi:integrase
MAKDLTSIRLAALTKAPPPARCETPDGKVRGLFFIVQPSGKASWAVRYRFSAAPRKLTIGSYPHIDLRAAREAASTALAKVAQGFDPAAEKKETSAAARKPADHDLVENVVTRFVERYAKTNTREASWRETERLLKKEIAGPWKSRRLSQITRADVHEILDTIVDRGSPILANRTLAALRRMCAWAVERGIIDASPCEKVKAPAPERSRDRVLSDKELQALWSGCDDIGWPFGPMFQLLVLTGQRRDEVAEMRWREVDGEKRTWTLPKERVKNNVEHVVPLSVQAIAILAALPRVSSKEGFVFTTKGERPVSGFSAAKDRIEALTKDAIGSREHEAARWTLHDIRRTVASGMARLGIHLPVIEKVLNHVSGNFGGIAGVYQRHSFSDEKRIALDTWGRFVEQIVTDRPAGNVVELAVERAL